MSALYARMPCSVTPSTHLPRDTSQHTPPWEMSCSCTLRSHRAHARCVHWEYARSTHRVHAATRRAFGMRYRAGRVSLSPAAVPARIVLSSRVSLSPAAAQRSANARAARARASALPSPPDRPAPAVCACRFLRELASPRPNLVLPIARLAAAPSFLLFPRPPPARRHAVHAYVDLFSMQGFIRTEMLQPCALAHITFHRSRLPVHAW